MTDNLRKAARQHEPGTITATSARWWIGSCEAVAPPVRRQLCRALIALPQVLAVIFRPYPARANAVIPPTAVPEMAAVSTCDVCMGPMTSRDVCTGSMSNRDASSTDVCGRNGSTADASAEIRM